MKAVVEQCTAINIGALQTGIRKELERNRPDSTEDEIFKFTEQELNKFRVNNQSFKYTYMKNKLGGYRWFFLCEKCNKRALKLFLPPKSFPEYEQKFLCKSCHGLLNESVMKANNNLYKKVIKPLRKLKKIEEKLEKGHLQEKKIEELLNEYDRIEQEMKTTPEYRLYAFKKKRGIKVP